MKRVLQTIGVAALGLAATLLAAVSPSMAASYTLSYTGTVSSASGEFAASGITSGDAVSGNITFDPLNTSPAFSDSTEAFYNEPAVSYSFRVQHDALDITHHDSGTGSIDNTGLPDLQQVELFGDGNDSSLDLKYTGTTGGPPLVSLLDLPNTVAGIVALVGPGGLNGRFVLDGFGQIGFGLTTTVAATPIPATLPLFAAALGGLGFVGWKRTRRDAAA